MSSFVETVLSAPDGGSLTAFTVRSNVSVAVRPLVAVGQTMIGGETVIAELPA